MQQLTNAYHSYFNGIGELRNWRSNTKGQNGIAFLKCLSYITVGIPLLIASGYGLALASNAAYSRISRSHSKQDPQTTIDTQIKAAEILLKRPSLQSSSPQELSPELPKQQVPQENNDAPVQQGVDDGKEEAKAPPKVPHQPPKAAPPLPFVSFGKEGIIPCLRQGQGKNDWQKCGYHAFKNAVVALAVGQGKMKPDAFDKDTAVYQAITAFVELHKTHKHHKSENTEADASIADLTAAWNALKDPADSSHLSLGSHSKCLALLKSAVMEGPQNSLSVLQTGGSLKEGHISPMAWDSLVNLIELSQREGPLHHVFVIGYQLGGEEERRHWVTIVLEKDADQRVKWHGLDSAFRGDQAKEGFSPLQRELEEVMNAEDPKEILLKTYNYSMDFHTLAKRKRWITQEKELNLRGPARVIPVLHAAAKFFVRAGWLHGEQKPEIQEHIANVRALIEFYQDKENQERFSDVNGNLLKEGEKDNLLAILAATAELMPNVGAA